MGQAPDDLKVRLKAVEDRVDSLSKRTGGMLSSTDLRKRVITKQNSGSDYEGLVALFKSRKWDELVVKNREGGFIIDPYDELNLTPFSYDLSIGDEVFSVRNRDRIRKRLPYSVEPGETVILLTQEFIALPPCYSATVWPRFNLVRGGIFQSMVKIDPTWYGRLGVAVTNFSPRTVTLEEGKEFGTLILYELSSATDIDLRQPEDLPTVKVKIPDIPLSATLGSELGKMRLTDSCWVEGGDLVIRGLKKSTYRKLLSIDASAPWHRTVETAKEAWLGCSGENRRSVGMEALEMRNLEKLVEGPPMGEDLDDKTVRAGSVTQDALYTVALEHGRPFDVVANIPKLVTAQVDERVQSRLDKEMAVNIIPRTVALMFSVLGFLSLVIAVLGLILRFFVGGSGFLSDTVLMVGLLIAVGFIGVVLLLAVKTGFSLRHTPEFAKGIRNEMAAMRRELEQKLADCRKSCR